MKNLKITLAAMMIALFTVFGANKAQAQITGDQVNTAVGNLVALQGVNVNVTDLNVVTIGDITITDFIDVTNVLNNNDVRVLNNILNNNTITIDNVLNNLLRDADIIKNNQIVVGILSGGSLLIMQQRGSRR